jgi:hypothetical protein
MRGRPWTTEEIKTLRRRYPDERTQDIATDLARNVTSVYSKAAALGLQKSEAFKDSEASGRAQPGKGVSIAGRFQRGHVPANKGKKAPATGRALETQFKPGSKPHNWVPTGSERILDGYLQRKMTDTGYPPRDWKFVHRLVWEQHNGPIPRGHVVVFRNGIRTDVRIENLELITRADLQRRNSVHNIPEGLREVINLRRQIVRHVNMRKRRGKEQD